MYYQVEYTSILRYVCTQNVCFQQSLEVSYENQWVT